MKRILLLMAIFALLSCGGVFKRGEKQERPPTPVLPEIQASVRLSQAWTFDAGSARGDSGVLLTPALDADTVFSADRKGRVYAHGLIDGKRKWMKNLKTEISGGVGSGDGLVLVGTSKGMVHALDARDGNEVWTRMVSSEVLAPPVAAYGMVVARTGDGRVFGLSSASGQPRWSFRRSVPSLSLRGAGTPLLHQQVVVVGFASGKIVAAEIESGRILWDVNVAQPRGRNEVERLVDIDARPVMVGSVIYVAAYQGRVTALALGSRRILWARDLSTFADLSVDDNYVYLSDATGDIYALDRLTGETLWKQDSLKQRQLSAPAGLRDHLVVGDNDGYVHVLAKVDGALVGRNKLRGGAVLQTKVVGDSQLLVLTQDGSLHSLKLGS